MPGSYRQNISNLTIVVRLSTVASHIFLSSAANMPAGTPFQQTIEGANMDYYMTGPAHSFPTQPGQYPFQQNDEWTSIATGFMQGSEHERRQGHILAGHTQPRGFSQASHSSQALAQSLQFAQYSAASVGQEQPFELTQSLGMGSNSTDFPMDLGSNGQYAFEDASAQIFSHQTSPSTAAPPDNSSLPEPDPSQNGWYQNSLHDFQFNTSGLETTVLDASSMDTAYGQNALSTLSTCTSAIAANNHSRDGYLTPATRSQTSPSKSLESMTDISSPTSDVPLHQNMPLSGTVTQEVTSHVCQWRLDGDQICGKLYDDNVQLHSHVADAHVNFMEAIEDHGFICRWKGCDRLTNKKRESKRGFDTKSKIRRHVEVHTGPCEFSWFLFALPCLYGISSGAS